MALLTRIFLQFLLKRDPFGNRNSKQNQTGKKVHVIETNAYGNGKKKKKTASAHDALRTSIKYSIMTHMHVSHITSIKRISKREKEKNFDVCTILFIIIIMIIFVCLQFIFFFFLFVYSSPISTPFFLLLL